MGWQPDRLLEGFECCELPLVDAPLAPGEPADLLPLTATLVRPVRADGVARQRHALLYVHGWNDYFFQRHLADEMTSLGYDFHALDLRRYGRSLRPGQLPGYIDDVAQYEAEFDAALEVLRRDHDLVTVMAHSAGGLFASLWAGSRPGAIDGLVLNSPWLAQSGNPLVQGAATAVATMLGPRLPTTVIPVQNNGLYRRTIEPSSANDWVMDEELKGTTSFKLRVGWFSAILVGQQRVQQGLSIDAPVLCLTSARSLFVKAWDEGMRSADTVLDVEAIGAAASRLGPHVTIVRIDGGLHDLALSAPGPRAVYFDEIRRWVAAYL